MHRGAGSQTDSCICSLRVIMGICMFARLEILHGKVATGKKAGLLLEVSLTCGGMCTGRCVHPRLRLPQ